MYNKQVESNKEASQIHNKNQKDSSKERLAKNAAYNKKFKPKKED